MGLGEELNVKRDTRWTCEGTMQTLFRSAGRGLSRKGGLRFLTWKARELWKPRDFENNPVVFEML